MQDVFTAHTGTGQLENARAMAQKGRLKEAEVRMLLMLDVATPDPEVLFSLGNIYERTRHYSLASACYNGCLYSDKKDKAAAKIESIRMTYGIKTEPKLWLSFLTHRQNLIGRLNTSVNLQHGLG